MRSGGRESSDSLTVAAASAGSFPPRSRPSERRYSRFAIRAAPGLLISCAIPPAEAAHRGEFFSAAEQPAASRSGRASARRSSAPGSPAAARVLAARPAASACIVSTIATLRQHAERDADLQDPRQLEHARQRQHVGGGARAEQKKRAKVGERLRPALDRGHQIAACRSPHHARGTARSGAATRRCGVQLGGASSCRRAPGWSSRGCAPRTFPGPTAMMRPSATAPHSTPRALPRAAQRDLEIEARSSRLASGSDVNAGADELDRGWRLSCAKSGERLGVDRSEARRRSRQRARCRRSAGAAASARRKRIPAAASPCRRRTARLRALALRRARWPS